MVVEEALGLPRRYGFDLTEVDVVPFSREPVSRRAGLLLAKFRLPRCRLFQTNGIHQVVFFLADLMARPKCR